jgi:hypothetical protein
MLQHNATLQMSDRRMSPVIGAVVRLQICTVCPYAIAKFAEL